MNSNFKSPIFRNPPPPKLIIIFLKRVFIATTNLREFLLNYSLTYFKKHNQAIKKGIMDSPIKDIKLMISRKTKLPF